MDYTVHETKTQLADVIRACAPKAVVHEWWLLKEDPKQWSAHLHSANDSNRTHGYIIEFDDSPNSQLSAGRVGGAIERFWTFQIFGLHYHNVAANTGTSQMFLDEIMRMADVFDKRASNFTIDGNPVVITLGDAVKQITTYGFSHRVQLYGGELCHALYASLTLKPC